ncbi:MAG: hypothetical protein WCO02_00230 [Bacteroidota bacterium]
MTSARYDRSEEILFIYNTCLTSFIEIANASREYFLNNEVPKKLKILEFATAEPSKMSLKERAKLKPIPNIWIENFSSIRHAVISTDLSIVVNVLLLQKEISHSKYAINIFSTEPAARRWLSEK